MWRRQRTTIRGPAAACRQWAILALVMAANATAQEVVESPTEPRVFAVLTDWTGHHIRDSSRAQRLREGVRDRLKPLLFDQPSQLGFDPERDRLLVARFGLVTDRSGIEPLRDFLQIQIDIDQPRPTAQAFANAFRVIPGMHQRSDGSRGAQWGFPSVVWSMAVDHINRRARNLGLTYESIVLVVITDDVPNSKGRSERTICERTFSQYPPYGKRDARRFKRFFDLYSRELELEPLDVAIDPINGVGEDDKAQLHAYRIAPVAAGINLNRVFDYDVEKFSLRADGQFHGQVSLELDLSPLAPALIDGLSIELHPADGGQIHGPALVMSDEERQTVWNQLPAELGTTSTAPRELQLQAAGRLLFPEVEELSQFRSELRYESPRPVEVEGLLELDDGSLLTADKMRPDETPKAAKERIDGLLGTWEKLTGIVLALLTAFVVGAIYYRARFVRPPLLAIKTSDPGRPLINWRAPEEILAAVPVGSIEIGNQRSRGGVHKEWTATLAVTDVQSDYTLVVADGQPPIDLFTFDSDGAVKPSSDEIIGKAGESIPLFLRANQIEDLGSPGLPRPDGSYRGQLEVTIEIRSDKKITDPSCVLTLATVYLAPKVEPRLQWANDPELADKVHLYTELQHQPAEVRRVSIIHDSDRQTLWPQPVQLAVLDPDGRSVRGLELRVPIDARREEEIEVDGASARIQRFGCRRAVEIPVLYTARDLASPIIRDTEIALQLYSLDSGDPRPASAVEAVSFKVGLASRGAHPILRMETFKDKQLVRIVDYPDEAEPAPETFELQAAYPRIPANAAVVDPWHRLATLEFGNRAERSPDGRGEVSFKVGVADITPDLEALGLSEDVFRACLRLVDRAQREDDSAALTNYLDNQPFGTLQPAPNAVVTYQLELDHSGFDQLQTETARIDFTLHFEGWLDGRPAAILSKKFSLPMVANYGDRWFLMDMGTSTIVASVMDVNRNTRQLLELVDTEKASAVSSDGHECHFLASTLFMRRHTESGDYFLEFKDPAEKDATTQEAVADAGRLLPPFKLLVGSKHLPLTEDDLDRLGLDQRPKIDDVLREAIRTLVDEKIAPALSRAKDEAQRELPPQVLLTIPNTFTPAHADVIREVFKNELGARRVAFLSESDAICWHYQTRVEKNEERLPEHLRGGLEYVLVVDIGAGTTDLTYVAIERRGSDEMESATILHRDGFRIAGNNVDTCFGRILHHKLASLSQASESRFLYRSDQQIFADGPTSGEVLEEARLYPIVQGLRRLKANLASFRGEPLALSVDADLLLREQKTGSTIAPWLGIETGEGGLENEIRFERHELLNAPAYSQLVHGEMSAEVLEHFFAGCPASWEGAPEGWTRDGRFPVDTLILTGRGALTPGLRKALEETLERYRLDTTQPIWQPEFSRRGTPDDLKLAVIQGGNDYIEKFGPDSGASNRDRLRDRGLYEDYYLYTGPGQSFRTPHPILDRDQHEIKTTPSFGAGGPLVSRFTRTRVPFLDDDGSVMVLSTSSRKPPPKPNDPAVPIRPLCQFRQGNLNHEVDIYFEVDSNRDYKLRVNGRDIRGSENRYDSELFEQGPGVLENMWPGRPCSPGKAADYFTSSLPRAGSGFGAVSTSAAASASPVNEVPNETPQTPAEPPSPDSERSKVSSPQYSPASDAGTPPVGPQPGTNPTTQAVAPPVPVVPKTEPDPAVEPPRVEPGGIEPVEVESSEVESSEVESSEVESSGVESNEVELGRSLTAEDSGKGSTPPTTHPKKPGPAMSFPKFDG